MTAPFSSLPGSENFIGILTRPLGALPMVLAFFTFKRFSINQPSKSGWPDP